MYEMWANAASDGKVGGAVFLDLSAAFDLVPPDILQKKLRIYGLQSSFLNFMKSYMTDRYQAVWIDNCFSNYIPCEVGVPQGSILGPLIFLIFINDLSYQVKSEVEQYADDTTISESDKNIQSISDHLNESCETVTAWMSQNQLKLNADKTHILMLGTQRRLASLDEELCIHMDGIQLKESETKSEIILGCHIQSDLKWSKQTYNLKQKLKKRLAGTYHLRGILPFSSMRMICEGWFTSVIVYCLPLFGGCESRDVDDLQKLQNKMARLVTNSQIRRNREEMFNQVEWLTVKQLMVYHTLTTVFRIRKTGEPEGLASTLNYENRNNNIIFPTSNLTLYRKSFTYRGICLWNRIPKDIKNVQTIGLFKSRLKEWVSKEVSKF